MPKANRSYSSHIIITDAIRFVQTSKGKPITMFAKEEGDGNGNEKESKDFHNTSIPTTAMLWRLIIRILETDS